MGSLDQGFAVSATFPETAVAGVRAGVPAPPQRLASPVDLGRTVFLSYNRESSREAAQLRDWLRDEGLDVFMDNVHLIAGELWLDRLKQEVAQALAFVVLMRREGPRGFVVDEVGWILQRRTAALARGAPAPGIFPVCLGEVPDERTLDSRVKALLGFQVTLWQPGQAMPVGLLAALREALPARHFALQQSPFRGLSTFEEQDAEWFFGRKREIHEVIDNLGSAPTNRARGHARRDPTLRARVARQAVVVPVLGAGEIRVAAART